MREELLRSKKFLDWLPAKTPTEKKVPYGKVEPFIYKGERYTNLVVDEKHYTPNDLAKAWGVSVDSIRRLFRDEPGVLKMGEKSPSHKRQYLTLRIPESVAGRVHKRLSE
jgi:hypothetical protein